jgi:hypothetical protein
MELTLEQVLGGKSTKIKNKEYFPTAAYVEPFIERLSKYTNNFVCKAVLPNQITMTKDGDINLEDQTWNRVWIQAILPDNYPIPNHNNVIGMVYGLDVRKPVFKVYRGGLNQACTNLCVFSHDMLTCQEIEAETPVDFRCVDRIIEDTDNSAQMIKRLMNTEFNTDERLVNENLGRWIRRCIEMSYNSGFGTVKVATSTPIDAIKMLFYKEDSDYFVGNREANMYDVYGAMTQCITNGLAKDIMNQTEKTLLIKSILGI